MPRVEFDTDSTLSPDRVVALLTDFSDRRPEVWPGLGKDAYRVYSAGDKTAEVREGNKSPKVWARERYDWSKPGTVRWEVLESSFCKPGGFVEVKVTPTDGGSRLHVTWNRSPSNLMGVIAVTMVGLTRGAPVKASLNAGLRKAEGADHSAAGRG
jgi:hypothetical protein